ncbi:TonB family protein [Hahella sp. KA22]|uniref:energy transducer TonB n=1 Tax=Hahella sp. KA22 TaxID=1628392 RepID=UPI000FDDA233|nr:energy transducer TonB [Hahella sp. KA22]AZZ95159.1 energy transducer TonB [Hahella sp. KA22]QAY52804.1 TonB family protein [Hahella sp. KA22]
MSTDVASAKYPPLLWMALVASLAAHVALMLYFNSPQPTKNRLTSTTMTVAIQAPAAPTPVSTAPAQAQPAVSKPTPQPVLQPAPQPQPVDTPEPVSPQPKMAAKRVETPVPKPKPVPASKPVVQEKTPKPTQAAHKTVPQSIPQTTTAKPQVTPAVNKPAQATPPTPASLEPAPVLAVAPVSAPVAVSAPSVSRYQLGEANTPKPEYPGLATRRGWQGTVMVELLVDAFGNPVKVSLKRSSGYTVLDKQALKTLSGWRLAAADGVDRETIVVPVVFRLN